ncbi:MAG: malectin domain-containing carbohydrate-binding protein, partial [Terracidiphilus sp.]
VYQNGRTGTETYTIPGMIAGSSHTVLLHFSENYWSAKAKRQFNVAINGATVLTNFDIYATAGTQYTAVVKTFTATANSSGQIAIAFTKGAHDQALIDGIEIR